MERGEAKLEVAPSRIMCGCCLAFKNINNLNYVDEEHNLGGG